MVSNQSLLHLHVNRMLDRIVSSRSARSPNAWFTWILAGALCGVGLASLVAGTTGFSPWLTAGTALGAGVASLGLAMMRKIWTGEESYAFYHYLLFVAGGSALAVLASGQPVWAYLDFILLAVAVSHAIGRLGCLLVGCCYGKPHGWGVRYETGYAHERDRTTCERLFPVLALESLLGFVLTVVIVALLFTGLPSGTGAVVYVTGYAMGRFMLEFLRGDWERPYYGPLSEAQWVSLFLLLTVAVAATAGIVPPYT